MLKNKAYTMIEMLLAILFLGFISIFYLQTNSFVNREAKMLAYQTIAENLAREPIELLDTYGYHQICQLDSIQIPGIKINQWQKMEAECSETGIERPAKAYSFERKVTVTKLTHAKRKALLIKVAVRHTQDRSSLFRTGEISNSGIILE